MPKWHDNNLDEHCDKHAACFTAIHGVDKSAFCTQMYKTLTHQCHRTHWMKYDAVSWDPEHSEYRPRQRYFVDDHPAIACTTLEEAVYLTYFHAHFGRGRCCTPPAATVADKRLMFSEWVQQAEQGRLLLEVEIIKNAI